MTEQAVPPEQAEPPLPPEPPLPSRPGRRDRAGAQLTEAVRFTERGYGSTCTACGSLVVGADGVATHRKHHRALAALGRELAP